MKELTTNNNQSINIFADSDSFAHAQRIAKMFASSDLVPATFKGNPANCVIAIEMAMRIKASPLMVMQNMYVVHGKPSWSSQFLIACINKSGLFSPIRYETSGKDGGSVRAYAKDLENNDICKGAWVSMDMATKEGWLSKKGSKWQTMPELMLRYRAAAFFQRQFCPEISMGFHTTEEIKDMSRKDENENTELNTDYSDVVSQMEAAETPEELEEIYSPFKDMPKKDIVLVGAYGKAKGRLGL